MRRIRELPVGVRQYGHQLNLTSEPEAERSGDKLPRLATVISPKDDWQEFCRSNQGGTT
jgi:hypothetical protein